MKKNDISSLVAIIIALIIGAGIALAGGNGGKILFGELNLFAFIIILAFSIQWIVFIHAYLKNTEKYFDLTGTSTYIVIIITSIILSSEVDFRSLLLVVLVTIWAGRLGIFLFRRILKAGKDRRFDEIKKSGIRYFQTWTIQGLWISLTIAAALAAITSEKKVEFGVFGIIGLIIWVIGFVFEAVADHQKKKFRKKPENKDKFINTGLWSISRHPNYFGEISIWIGIALIAWPTLEGLRIITIISPVFVAFLIIKISGIPKLEKYADKKWGGEPDYEEYKKNTPVLIPKMVFTRATEHEATNKG